MSTTLGAGSVNLIDPGEPLEADGWQVSSWNAGQSSILAWAPGNVRLSPDGALELALGTAPAGSARPWCGGEVQSEATASTGTWSWTAQAPRMVDGAVFGMFTYRADHFADPWIEFDFEFVGADTTQVRLNIHMETATGEHVTLEDANGAPVIVNLGFDAALGVHTYSVTVTGTEAVFLVDGREVGRFDASDMPHGTWTTGEMKGFANLWCVDPSLESWAGVWSNPGTPLVAHVESLGFVPGDGPPPDPGSLGTPGDDILIGSDGDDLLDGLGGHDSLDGGAGNDQVLGGDGGDRLRLDAGDDRLDGGAGLDWVEVLGSLGATIDLSTSAAQATGHGTDRLSGIENALGDSGADRLSGTGGASVLIGAAGDDVLRGGEGADRLVGGLGRDTLHGGIDRDRDVFVFSGAEDSPAGPGRDILYDVVSGIDLIDLSGIDPQSGLGGDQGFRFAGKSAAAFSVWTVASKGDLILRADVTGDRTADIEIRLVGVSSLTASDLLL
ncbi:MAG: Alkaline phosphatase [uncultured Rubellimicrobium sp.]|uniref:Alkaline phosphatase n=1 Tax=uncultured Rubellimicrobium sp. TaxID=543078 RepID=A0A6J4NJY8_9RHOB|nr:MAG: Alkaline phosphatase [uncultured Rubellimicrobium sp.]